MSNSNQFSRKTTTVTGWLSTWGLSCQFICDDCFDKQTDYNKQSMRRDTTHYTRLVDGVLCVSDVRCSTCNVVRFRSEND